MTGINFTIGEGYILAAEDSLVQARKLAFFFENYKIRYAIAKNGQDALDKARNEKPLLIISDVVMPVMDGYAFCRNVKSDAVLMDVPFILLTSLSDPLDIIKGLQAGADNFITKPYEETYLMSRIGYLLTNKYIRQQGTGDMSIEIVFQNQKFLINSDKKQILDLLLSVYEAAISRNTQLIEAQRELQRLNADLKSANAELEAFAHTVSHDLKSPLNGILGFSDLLIQDYSDKLDSDAIEYLDWIVKSAKNMSQLIEDLLSFSRSGRLDINPVELNLSTLSREIIDDLRKANYHGNYTIAIEEGINVVADKHLMAVAMTNLLSNALKYSQKSEHPKVTVGTTVMNEKRVIYVKDNGAGFDMDKADTLFKPFIRLHANNEFQGTGVGLSTVKRVIERHGGSIWYEAYVGKGAVFFFTLS